MILNLVSSHKQNTLVHGLSCPVPGGLLLPGLNVDEAEPVELSLIIDLGHSRLCFSVGRVRIKNKDLVFSQG